MTQRLLATFETIFGRRPGLLARAPGRVNVIGEHTDYNDGFVLPAAIEREVRIAAAARGDDKVRIVALDLGRETTFELRDLQPSIAEPWSNHVRGVVAGLLAAGFPLRGVDALLQGNIPIGAGLSSSAAVEMATVQAFAAAGCFVVPPSQAARIGQKAEHEFVGIKTGLMDQLASALGEPDHVLMIDCRSLQVEAVPFPDRAAILIADTAVRRQLVSSAYNERRAQCEEAAVAMAVPALRDATLEMLRRADVTDIVARRARHVIEENARVLETVDALRDGNLRKVGALMNASHCSLRDLYDVSSHELDVMVQLLRDQPGCYGARLTGAGFGGCCVALMDASAVDAAGPRVTEAYQKATGLVPALYPTRATRGATAEILPSNN